MGIPLVPTASLPPNQPRFVVKGPDGSSLAIPLLPPADIPAGSPVFVVQPKDGAPVPEGLSIPLLDPKLAPQDHTNLVAKPPSGTLGDGVAIPFLSAEKAVHATLQCACSHAV